MTPSVAVAVLTWRGESTTRSCLASLHTSGGWTGPTVVVDNGSGTGEGERLAAEFGADSVTLATNGGVPAGYNAAIRWARGHGATHVLLANNDLTFRDEHAISRLLALMESDVAAVGPVIRAANGTVQSAGTTMRRWSGHAQRRRAPWASSPYLVDALDGSCLLVSIEAACRVGGLEPEFFLYWEETDWCTRAQAAGFRLLVDPGATVTHAGWGSGNVRQTRRFALRNSLLYLRRNVRGVRTLTTSLAWLFGRLPVFIVRRLLERASVRTIAADTIWAIGWHVRDIRGRGWHRPAEGPTLCL